MNTTTTIVIGGVAIILIQSILKLNYSFYSLNKLLETEAKAYSKLPTVCHHNIDNFNIHFVSN